MIYLNGSKIDFSTFPDGTLSARMNLDGEVRDFGLQGIGPMFAISWNYEGDHECFALWCIVKHMRDMYGKEAYITLDLPYVPNARMDRVKNNDEVFTLKWFADFINSMSFEEVRVLDPHSNVAPALIDRCVTLFPLDCIDTTINELCADDPIICYPDEGASKRYSDRIKSDYTFCIKRRNWRDGQITGTTLMDSEKVKNRNVLIIDDICSRGGTFIHTAKALKEAGAKKIYLYVTHCENTIMKGDVFKSGLIEHVFTTNSIFTEEVDDSLMTVYEV